MKLILYGYGKMGKEVEKLALKAGHEIILKISSKNFSTVRNNRLPLADVAIEFSAPQAAFENVIHCFNSGIPVVSGTTGWNQKIPEAAERCLKSEGAFLHASNFSIGVNLFFKANRDLAKLMSSHPEWVPEIQETHHTEKIDYPSGTAISIAEAILKEQPWLKKWNAILGESPGTISRKDELQIKSFRKDNIPGTHTVFYRSPNDEINIQHTAHNREGFATGALHAAAWIAGKKGVFSMNDMLNSETKTI